MTAAMRGSARATSDKKSQRLLALVNGVLYGLFCANTAALAAGSPGSTGANTAEVDATGNVMRHSLGRPLVGIVGAVVIVAGAMMAWPGAIGQTGVRATGE